MRPNEIPTRVERGLLATLRELVRQPMLVLLAVAAGLYGVFGSTLDAVALAVSVVAIATITILQERRTERAIAALREVAAPRARAFRGGAWRDLDARDLVVGDRIKLEEGGRVPADAALREGTPLAVDESLLTGESAPVLHALGDGGELGAGTLVVSGRAVAEVVRVGADSAVGKIGGALATIDLAAPPLHRDVTRAVRAIAIAALALSLGLVATHLALGHPLLVAVLAGITLAMSLLPEELPLVTTIFLAMGARRLARDRVLARRASAIETLGALTVLCVDKTGTLTRNRMTVAVAEPAADVHRVVAWAARACPPEPTDPMDRALDTRARELELREDAAWVRARDYPLAVPFRAAGQAWRRPDGTLAIACKGAPETVLAACRLEPEAAAAWQRRVDDLAASGLRVLAVAVAEPGTGAPAEHLAAYTYELVGLVAFEDPLRDETRGLVAECRRAGIAVLMLTGDHVATARRIAALAGIAGDAATGAELEALDADALAARLAGLGVIARATPALKLRVVEALAARGEVVGMTGDGVNDAPALTAAHVGIAMGRGTDVAREAGGLVVLDDALASIVGAIAGGRRIYDNLQNVATYLLAVHVPIALLALLPALLGWPLLLAPVHIVFLELLIDPTSSFVFEAEPATGDVMARPPRRRDTRLVDRTALLGALGLGLAAACGPLAAAALALGRADDELRTFAFAALVGANLGLILVARRRPAARAGARNPVAPWVAGAILATLAVVLVVPALRLAFGLAPLPPGYAAGLVVFGAAPVVAFDLLRGRRARGALRRVGAT